MRRLLLARHVLGAMTESTTLAKVAGVCVIIAIVAGLVAGILHSATACLALVLALAFCGYLVWTIEPALRDLNAKIVQLVQLEIGGHGLIIDFEKPDGRTFLSGDVKVQNATGCQIKLRSYVFEQIGIDAPGAVAWTLQAPESTCDDIIPNDASRYIKLEKHEFFGGRESFGDAACVPINLTISVRFEIDGEHITDPATRTLQCYALIRSAPREKMLLLR
jgi:hypothetical protein